MWESKRIHKLFSNSRKNEFFLQEYVKSVRSSTFAHVSVISGTILYIVYIIFINTNHFFVCNLTSLLFNIEMMWEHNTNMDLHYTSERKLKENFE